MYVRSLPGITIDMIDTVQDAEGELDELDANSTGDQPELDADEDGREFRGTPGRGFPRREQGHRSSN